jgi:peroxiredoxin
VVRSAFAAAGVTALLLAASAAQARAQAAAPAAPAAPAPPQIVLQAPQVDPPWLGLLRPQQGVFGVQVVEVYEDSGAAAAGLLPGDEILFLDDVPVTGVTELVMVVQHHVVGDVVEVRLVRHNVEMTMMVQLGARVDDREMLHRRLVGKPAPSVRLRRLDDDRLFDPSSLRGKVVVLAWFSTRCDACGEIISGLSEWASRNRRDTVVAAVTSAEPGPLSTYLARSAISVPVAVAADDDFQRYGLLGGRGDALVAFVVIDRNGIVRMAAAVGDGSDSAEAAATIDDVIAGARQLLRGGRR